MTDQEREHAIRLLSGDKELIEEELAHFALLPPAKRAIVDQRLSVMSRYVESRRRRGRPHAGKSNDHDPSKDDGAANAGSAED